MIKILPQRWLLAAVLGAALMAFPVASEARNLPARNARSSTEGASLLKRAEHRLVGVPGVVLSFVVKGVDSQFITVLKHGDVASEEYVGVKSGETTRLVSTNGSPTYAEEPGTKCWRALARSAPQTLTDIGHPLLDFAGASVSKAQAEPTGWKLTLRGQGTVAVITLDKSLRVETIRATNGKQNVLEKYKTLTTPPKLPQPTPRCA